MIVIVTIVIKKMRRKIGLMCGQSDFFSYLCSVKGETR